MWSCREREGECVEGLESNLLSCPFSNALLWWFPLAASEIWWEFSRCGILMLRLSCNNELDSCSTSVSYTYKKSCVEIQGRKMVSLGFLLQLSGHYGIIPGLQSLEFEDIYNRKYDKITFGIAWWKDMLTAKKKKKSRVFGKIVDFWTSVYKRWS